MTLIVFIVSLLGAMAIGVPVAFALMFCGVILMSYMGMFNTQIIAQNMIAGADTFTLLAIPFFILACSLIFFWGTWQQYDINASMTAPVTGISMIWVYGVGLFSGGGLALISLERLVRCLTGRVTEEEIRIFAGENMTIEQLAERT